MGHSDSLKLDYIDLAKRLQANVVGMPEPQNIQAWEGWKNILDLLYEPMEAKIAARMPVHPTPLEKIAERTKTKISILQTLLNSMAEKGIVVDIIDPETGKYWYSLSPPVVGFFELTMMKIGQEIVSKQDVAEAIALYGGNSTVLAKEIHGSGKTALGRTLVYDSLIQEERIPQVYEWERAVSLIENSKLITVSNCYCRHKAEHLGSSCDAPQETCISFDHFGEYVLRRNFGRKIGTTEAIEILLNCREYNLVHLVDNVKKKPAWLCNCCSCCCGIIKSINSFGFPAANPSGFIPFQDNDKCIGCKKCVKSCPINAITVNKVVKQDKYYVKINEEICIGCGVCISNCQKKVLTLSRRKKAPCVPNTKLELQIHRSVERGKLAELIFNKSTGWGLTFVNFFFKDTAHNAIRATG